MISGRIDLKSESCSNSKCLETDSGFGSDRPKAIGLQSARAVPSASELRLLPSPSGRRNDEHAVDAALVHVDDFEAIALDGKVIADARHAIDLRHHEAAERVKVAALLARQLRKADDVPQLVDRHHAVD